ncbi:MAG TPA: hypothetical protein VE326_05085 [Candidatus Binatia bacterium]|nr:hypothetical protein [Candidatus Binatia bacterium]
MGQGTHGVKASPEELKREVEAIREEMTPVLDELDHRRHEMTDWKLQLRRRGPALLGVVAGIAAVVITLKMVKRRLSRS